MVFHIAGAIHVFGFEAAALKFIKDCPVRFLHDIRENRQTAPVWHADNNVFDTKRTTTLDNLLHRGHQTFTAVQTKPFGSHVFDMQELFETLGLDQLAQDRFAPLFGKGDFLAITLDPLFEPAGLLGVGNMHVLERKGAAIRGPHDVQYLLHRRNLETQYLVDKDRALHVRIAEPVGLWIKFGVRRGLAHAQRVQIGHQMAPDAVGADDHQGADGIQHRLLDLVIVDDDTFFGSLGFYFVPGGGGLFGFGPDTGQRAHHVAGGRGRPVAPCPAWPGGLGFGGLALVAHFLEKIGPCGIYCIWIIGIPRIHLFEVIRVFPLHKGGRMELVVGVLFGHHVTCVWAGNTRLDKRWL